jgi:hypothetical protein
MTDTTNTASQDDLGTEALTVLKTEGAIAISTFLPVLNSFFDGIKSNAANASVQNLLLEGPAVFTALQAALPTLEENETMYLAGEVQMLLNKYSQLLNPTPVVGSTASVSTGTQSTAS